MVLKITNIDWCIEEEDIVDYLELEENDPNYDREVEKERQQLLNELPNGVDIEISKTELYEIGYEEGMDLMVFEDFVNDYLADEYGWLVYGYDIKVI